jgi:hypothetical protein
VYHHHQVGQALVVMTPIVRTSAGMQGWAIGDAVLHLHLRYIEVGAEIEGHVDLEAAVARRIRDHVGHVLDAIDLLLQRGNHW